MSAKPAPPPGLDAMATLLKKLVAVPKKELDAQLARERERKARASRRRPA